MDVKLKKKYVIVFMVPYVFVCVLEMA